mgnify:CR=1 FL=1
MSTDIADPFVEPYIQHGEKNLSIEQEKLVSRSREPDTVSRTFQSDSASAYPIGGAIAGYTYMPIVDRERNQSGPLWVYRLQLEGIADDSKVWIETDYEESTPEEGWDEIRRSVFTRDPTDASWNKGARLLSDALTGVIGTASTDKLGKTAHGLLTGQLFVITFASGFTGLTSGTEYYAIRIDADNIKAATTSANALAGTAINITADGTGATITPVPVGYEFLWIMDRGQRKHRAAGYWEVNMTLKGLRGEKPYKRRYSGTPQTMSPGQYTGSYSGVFGVNVGWPPVAGTDATLSGSDLNLEWDVPQTQIVDTFVTSTPPPTDKFGFWIPDDPPPVFYFPMLGLSYTYHIPFGWKLMNMQAEQLPGQQLWILSLTFGYQYYRTPKAA